MGGDIWKVEGLVSAGPSCWGSVVTVLPRSPVIHGSPHRAGPLSDPRLNLWPDPALPVPPELAAGTSGHACPALGRGACAAQRLGSSPAASSGKTLWKSTEPTSEQERRPGSKKPAPTGTCMSILWFCTHAFLFLHLRPLCRKAGAWVRTRGPQA